MFKLRELQRKDLERITQWRNNPELIALLGAPFRYINPEVDIRWFENYMSNRGNAVRCAIVEEEKDEILGLVSLTGIDFINQSAELHIMIGDKENRGKGMGTYAVRTMLSHAFFNMNLHRVELGVLDSNFPAIGLYEKCGFVQEGIKKSALYKNGNFVDLRMYACLKENYINLQLGGVKLPSYCIREVEESWIQRKIVFSIENVFEVPLSALFNIESVLQKVAAYGCFLEAYATENLGFVALYANDLKDRIGYVTLIGVKEQVQCQGVGKALLNACEAVARSREMNSLKLEVSKTNEKAVSFYKKQGFIILEEDTEKTWYMWKSITE